MDLTRTRLQAKMSHASVLQGSALQRADELAGGPAGLDGRRTGQDNNYSTALHGTEGVSCEMDR